MYSSKHLFILSKNSFGETFGTVNINKNMVLCSSTGTRNMVYGCILPAPIRTLHSRSSVSHALARAFRNAPHPRCMPLSTTGKRAPEEKSDNIHLQLVFNYSNAWPGQFMSSGFERFQTGLPIAAQPQFPCEGTGCAAHSHRVLQHRQHLEFMSILLK